MDSTEVAAYLLFLSLLLGVMIVGALPRDCHEYMRKSFPWPTQLLTFASSWLELIFGLGGLTIMPAVAGDWPPTFYALALMLPAVFVFEGAFRIAMVHKDPDCAFPSLLTWLPIRVFRQFTRSGA